MLRIFSDEVRRFFESEAVRREFVKALGSVVVEIKAEIRVRPNEAGELEPEVKADVKTRAAEKPRKDEDVGSPPSVDKARRAPRTCRLRRLEEARMAIDAEAVKTLAVVGAGQMGSGIAQVAAQAGLAVILADATPELAQRGARQAAGRPRQAGREGEAPGRRAGRHPLAHPAGRLASPTAPRPTSPSRRWWSSRRPRWRSSRRSTPCSAPRRCSPPTPAPSPSPRWPPPPGAPTGSWGCTS